jgi:UPF0271 protein
MLIQIMQYVDVNCDMGEGFGNYQMLNDEKLMDYISSANIACGFHAGDPSTMHNTVLLAIKKGIAVGAHPGLPDLQGFGRREMVITEAEAYQMCIYQISALNGFVSALNGTLNHVKPHGALYNMAAKDPKLARAIAKSVYDLNPSLKLYALAGSEMIKAANELGLATVSEVFADRSYQDDGNLTPRSYPNALIKEEIESINQVLMMVKQGKVMSTSQRMIPIVAETICLHSDGDHAVLFAEKIAIALKADGIMIKANGNS